MRGVGKNLSFETLRVQLRAKVRRQLPSGHARLVQRQAPAELLRASARRDGPAADTLKRDLGQVLLKVEELQEQHIRKTVEPQRKEVVLNDDEREAALALLRDPKFLDRILADFERCGVVGEPTNKLVGYLAAVSRKLDDAAGRHPAKHQRRRKILAHGRHPRLCAGGTAHQIQRHDRPEPLLSRRRRFAHKVLAIVEEEGAERASYALKLLQSEGELTIASTGKDPQSGRMVTQEYHVEGPVMIMLTTTAIDIDEELLNRCIVLTVDESREQTRRIHELQREARTLDGLRRKLDKTAISPPTATRNGFCGRCAWSIRSPSASRSWTTARARGATTRNI